MLDLTLLVLAAPIVLPVLLLLVLLIRCFDGPAFFVQDRLGKHGRTFQCWKLRTMVVNAERILERHLAENPEARSEWETHQKLRHDPRITPIGRILRKSSLDELPQLWNVLRGDMSLVGPRPMLPEQLPLYPGTSYLQLRPGLTGSWQVGARHSSAFADRARYDDQYAAELSLWTDLQIILATTRVVARGTGQ
ncbi:sugar transferase [Rubellimicrobium mesophilum]|uniref:sugar transferase n=1 Tax=Rubellimicrobium mesophilum TaxID=1123067 RepID=UPI001FE1B0B1|nr:sugar transferase [Rubellimicrobium mesophilum]